jgi:hypothetical protein
MAAMRRSAIAAFLLFPVFGSLLSVSAAAQTTQQPAPAETPQQPQQRPPAPPTHDISQVDPAPLGGVIAVPLPESERKRLKRYDIPELVGAQQALGSQLIDGELPRPLADYVVTNAGVIQRLSIFEHGLTVVHMQGTGGTMLKKLILPQDALAAYLKSAAPDVLRLVARDVTPPSDGRKSLLRIYRVDRSYAELAFDPAGAIPKPLGDEIRPLEDLLRAISEDRMVTNSVSGYEPKVGDELVGDDRKVWQVQRIIEDSGIVQLHCVGEPTIMYVAKKDLYNYFIGKPH